jgi:sarcosine oxidase
MHRYDAIVLGVGGMGSAVLSHLARCGLSVLGIERFEIAHDRGSSHGHTRIIRRAYFEHPDYIPLLNRTYELWDELQSQTDDELIRRTGLVLAGPADGPIIAGVRASDRQHSIGIETLAPSTTESRFPGLRVPSGMDVLFERDAGFLRVENCVRAHAESAVRHGATIEPNVCIRRWSSNGDTITVETDAQRYVAKQLVICGGAWSIELLAELNLPLEVRRKVQPWFATDDARYALESGFPVFGIETDGLFVYGFPSLDGRTIKVADHTHGRVAAPERLDRSLEDDDLTVVRDFIRAHLPGVKPECVRHQVCMYTMTPDEHFILDRHPRHNNVAIAAGFSGHGFKFAPVVGEVMADLTTTGRTRHPIDFLSIHRPALKT